MYFKHHIVVFILLEIKPHQLLYNMGHYGLVTPENILIVDYGKSTVNNDMKTYLRCKYLYE